MEEAKDTKGGSWYSKLIANITGMADQLELESEQREDFRTFIMQIARDQYKAGNNAGIRWLRLQIAKEQRQDAAPQAA